MTRWHSAAAGFALLLASVVADKRPAPYDQYKPDPYNPYPAGDPYKPQPSYEQPQPYEHPQPPYSPSYKQEPAYPSPYPQPQPHYAPDPYAHTGEHQAYPASSHYKPQPSYAPEPAYPQQYPQQRPQYPAKGYVENNYGHREQYPKESAYPKQPPYKQQPSYGKPAYAAVCDFSTGAGSGKVQGRLTLTQGAGYDEPVQISGYISPLKPGKHGFHIHMYGDFSDGCASAGGHYNPTKATHGSPNDDLRTRHVGDLGNIEAGYDGVANVDVSDSHVSLADGAKHPIGGRAIVVHEKPDDLGRGGDDESKKTGNAGARLGCCVITRVDPEKLKY